MLFRNKTETKPKHSTPYLNLGGIIFHDSVTRTGETKGRILNLIASGNKTLSDLSAELGLAPSTINQHLNELKDLGAIREVDTERTRKWKYYEINPGFSGTSVPGFVLNTSRMPRKIFYYAAAIGMVAAIAYIVLISNSANVIPGSLFRSMVPVRLTDPPHVPAGTQSLVINYSSVALHAVNESGQGWITSNYSGSVNLMSLINTSQVIGGLDVPSNSTIDGARFNITSAIITINGTAYNVTVPIRTITAHFSGKVNSTTGILMDLSPTVAAITTNSTTLFLMVPSLKAIIIPDQATSMPVRIGATSSLTKNDIHDLDASKSNLSISGAQISQSNDIVGINITLKNNGNKVEAIRDVLITGNQTPVIVYGGNCSEFPGLAGAMYWCDSSSTLNAGDYGWSSVLNNVHTVASVSADAWMAHGAFIADMGAQPGSGRQFVMHISSGYRQWVVRIPYSAVQDGGDGTVQVRIFKNGTFLQNGITTAVMPIVAVEFTKGVNYPAGQSGNITLNGTALYRLVTPVPASLDVHAYDGTPPLPMPYVRGVVFLTDHNGTLMLANQLYAGPSRMYDSNESGYSLGPGNSTTLHFDGQMLLPSNLKISLSNGSKYRIEVFGSDGAYAIANVTAT